MFDIISFSCVAITEKAQGVTFSNLTVTPFVNGKELIPERKFSFDAGSVLAQQADRGGFHPFVCGCGTAGCAGIFHMVQVFSDSEKVTWRFPQEPFAEHLDQNLIFGRDSLLFIFEVAQYNFAIEKLRSDILGVEQKHGKVNYRVDPLLTTESFYPSAKTRMANERERRLERLKKDADKSRLYGDLLGAKVNITFPNNAKIALKVEHLINTVALQAAPTGSGAHENLVSWISKLKGNPDAALMLSKTLSWGEIWEICWIEESGDLADDEMNDFSEIIEPLYKSAVHTYEFDVAGTC